MDGSVEEEPRSDVTEEGLVIVAAKPRADVDQGRNAEDTGGDSSRDGLGVWKVETISVWPDASDTALNSSTRRRNTARQDPSYRRNDRAEWRNGTDSARASVFEIRLRMSSPGVFSSM